VRRRSPSRCLACDIEIIFDRDRNTQERKPHASIQEALRLYSLAGNRVMTHDPVSVQFTVEAGDPVQIQLDQRGRRDRARRQHSDLLGRSRECRSDRIHPRNVTPRSLSAEIETNINGAAQIATGHRLANTDRQIWRGPRRRKDVCL
jgi:hypothetical protein